MDGKRPGRIPAGRGRASRPLRTVPDPPDPDAIRAAYRGRKRDALLLELAMEAESLDELARREGVEARDLGAFAEEYALEIVAIREAMVDRATIDTAGLWIAAKRARIAEYQADVEDIDATLAEYRQLGVPWSRSHRDMERIKLDLFRQVADELGAYPQRQAAPSRQGSTVHYVIETDDEGAMT